MHNKMFSEGSHGRTQALVFMNCISNKTSLDHGGWQLAHVHVLDMIYMTHILKFLFACSHLRLLLHTAATIVGLVP